MPLVAGCPRCSLPLADSVCTAHPDAGTLWRAATPGYDAFAALLTRAHGAPTLLPWPMTPGWSISDFGYVGRDDRVLATVTTVAGTSDLDGDVEVSIVVEEPGVGLGARVARLAAIDPGRAVGQGPASVRVRLDRHPIPLWAVPSGEEDEVLATSVFAGQTEGNWLWLVLHPASAALLLREDWLLRDAAGFGPEAIELSFGGSPGSW